jgi:uncharacterized membrane-anchored protein YitT (DUF2179 family)
MTKGKKIKKKIDSFLFDHPVIRFIVEYSWALVLCLFSASIFAFGFSAFVTPGDNSGLTIITGGGSGVAQIVALIFTMCGIEIAHSTIVAISFVGVNLPLIIFSFKFIGIRFATLTCLNVVLTAVLMTFFDPTTSAWVHEIASSDLIKNQTIVRSLFGGVCTGLSSAAAFAGYFSAGGIDIISYYFALRKSTSVGKYALLINFIIIVLFTSLSVIGSINGSLGGTLSWADYILGFLFAIVYLAVVSIVIDIINVRNKKVRIDIITVDEHLSDLLIANFPHGITINKGIGGFSHKEKFILTMAVSSSEVKRVVALIRTSDPKAFIEVINLQQIYGNFFINPIR